MFQIQRMSLKYVERKKLFKELIFLIFFYIYYPYKIQHKLKLFKNKKKYNKL